MLCSIIAALHIIGCLYFTFFPKGPLAGTRIGAIYKVRMLTGPFFTSDRLQISPHLLVNYKTKEGTWSPCHDVGAAKLELYQHAPWKFNELARADFLRHIGRKFHKVQNQENVWLKDEFITLNSFLVREVLPAQKPDSVGLTYILNYYDPALGKVESDTVWSIAYNLHDKRVR